ncbi:hypothetical protein BKA82DRAFT_4330895 [Pisolithus tinctorius]|nr:hypothetical protein BKA82DRAFT_4330895 [Pisolithus tinctorius]
MTSAVAQHWIRNWMERLQNSLVLATRFTTIIMQVLMVTQRCDSQGHFLPDDAPLPLCIQGLPDDWAPYHNRLEFELAKFLFKCAEMPANQIDTLLEIWATLLLELGGNPLFANHTDLYCVIDSMSVGTVKWENFKITYKHKWDDQMDFMPYWEFNATSDQRCWEDFMLGNWAWGESDKIISDNPSAARATLVPIILGSDKPTVSIATGQTDYYPLYLSIRNVCNTTHHAHCDVVVLIGFLAMPKTTREHANTQVFRKFKKQLFGDIVPFTSRFPCADIQRMLSLDILHQLIKGGFKDHLVDWVEGYLIRIHGKGAAEKILDDIDRRIAAVALFTGLRSVKRPYRHTNCFQALGQMLAINQRLDKFAAACADFEKCGMLRGTCLSHVLGTLGDCEDSTDEPTASFEEDAGDMDDSPMSDEAHLLNILCHFLQSQLQHDDCNLEDVPLDEYPFYDGSVCVYNSASSMFYAPSDMSGLHGMCHEHIRCSPMWRNEGPRYDCTEYPCVIIHWFSCVGDGPDTNTGMWIVRMHNAQDITIIHIDTIYRTAQLIPIYFYYYYVNRFADHHVFEIAS